ncbi:acyl-CoA dehydrogenase [Amycolatopsis marina]|uniref:Acyl-CoA dehydrogenase n=1 Tax=Amycolatopsis marina TaxID=490629 RepID=A0A1I1ATK0_9PSEU|nr:acyl-CoA dehydrogenase family protein [Amycolatopsis marina]SFB40746.1 acyl-CoA dehydrogenase [Amycolatopsis marina]
MQLAISSRGQTFLERLTQFMEEWIYPSEAVYKEQILRSGDPNLQPPIMEKLKAEARERGLWNLFHPDPRWGSGLSNVDYAYLAEVMGRSSIAPEACNCSAPDTGNMEILSRFGSQAQQLAWLEPLLAGEIRSAFCMTEPDVASSDATNIRTSIERVGDEYVINGRKWWSSNVLHPNCRVLLVLGQTDPDAPRHRRQSIVIVPIDSPGVKVLRGLSVFGYQDQEGHGEVEFNDVRVPIDNLVGVPGQGFEMGQARLGPGRIHHCMRAVGTAERALELMCARATSRTTFGRLVSDNANIQDWIAESRVEIEMVRLLILKTAWLVDTTGNKDARVEIAAIKVAAPHMALRVLDRAIQVHGGGGVSGDFPLAAMWAFQRTLRIGDGPDEVHKRSIARRELAPWLEPRRADLG